jgi:hypothetical protein
MPGVGWTHPGAIILHTSAHAVGDGHVVINMVKLPHRQIFGKPPVFTPVAGNVEASVISFDQVIGIFRVHPKGMVVRVNPRIPFEGVGGAQRFLPPSSLRVT